MQRRSGKECVGEVLGYIYIDHSHEEGSGEEERGKEQETRSGVKEGRRVMKYF
jgi:hypothetical protein